MNDYHMNSYQEITLLPPPEISLYFVWQTLYQIVHLKIVETKHTAIENWIFVTFPEYSPYTLGSKLRIFGTETGLATFNIKQALHKLEDYLHTTPIRDVPQSITGYSRFKRLQTKQGSASQAKRRALRLGQDFDRAYTDLNQKPPSRLPFLQLKSLSTGQAYKVRIQQIHTNRANQTPVFNAYGLNHPLPLF